MLGLVNKVYSSNLYDSHKTSYEGISHRSRAVTAKKCTKSVLRVQNCCNA